MDKKTIQQLAEETLQSHLGLNRLELAFWKRIGDNQNIYNKTLMALCEMFEAGAADKGLVLKDGLIEYIYDFAWHYGRLFHLGSAEEIRQAIKERFQLPEEWLEEAPAPQAIPETKIDEIKNEISEIDEIFKKSPLYKALSEAEDYYELLSSRNKPFFVDTFRKLLGQYDNEEISLSKLVECLNTQAFKWHQANIQASEANDQNTKQSKS
jgi:hypothetical protein